MGSNALVTVDKVQKISYEEYRKLHGKPVKL